MRKLMDKALLTEQEDIDDLVSDLLAAAEEEPEKPEEKPAEPKPEEPEKIPATREKESRQELIHSMISQQLRKEKSSHEQLEKQLERSVMKGLTGRDLIRVRGYGWFDRDAYSKGDIDKVKVDKETLDQANQIVQRGLLNYWASNYGMGMGSKWVDKTGRPVPPEHLLQLSVEYSKAKEPEKGFDEFLQSEGFTKQPIRWQDTKPYEAGEALIGVMEDRIDRGKERIQHILAAAEKSGIPNEAIMHTPPAIKAAKGRARPGVKGGVSQTMTRGELEKGIRRRRTLPDEYERKYGSRVWWYRRLFRYWEGIIRSSHNMIAQIRSAIGHRREGAKGYNPGDWEIPPLQEPERKIINGEVVYDPRGGRGRTAWQHALAFAKGAVEDMPPAKADQPSRAIEWMYDTKTGMLTPDAIHYILSIAMNRLVSYSSYQAMREVPKVFTPSQTRQHWKRVRGESIETPDDTEVIFEIKLR